MEAALNEERQYLDRVRELRAKLYDAQGATEDRLRDIQRRGMSEAQQQADLLAQAKKKQAKAAQLAARAEQAAIEGRSKDAERLAQLAQREAEGSQSLAERLKDNRQAYSLVAAGGQLVERAIRAEIDANGGRRANGRNAPPPNKPAQQQTLALVAQLNAELKRLTTEDKRVAIRAEISDAQAAIGRIQDEIAALKDKTITVTVLEKSVAARQHGGPVGFGQGGACLVTAVAIAFRRFSKPASSCYAKEAVRKYGLGLIWQLNQLRFDLAACRAWRWVGWSVPPPAAGLDAGSGASGNAGGQHHHQSATGWPAVPLAERPSAGQATAGNALKYLQRGSP